jgi:ABC-type lipoprotein export system ATPase subunit
MNNNVISMRNVKKYYDRGVIKALDGVDLEIREGEFVAIMGPSGSGKSTMLNMLGALDTPDAGEIEVAGRKLSAGEHLAAFRRDIVGFVFQMHNLIPTLSAAENVQIPLMEKRISPSARRRRALELLTVVGLEDRAGSLPTDLSGGERQRVAIARALANDPAIILADEPTGSVDSVNAGRIMDLLKQISRERGVTLLVVTHDEGVAAQAGRIVRMLDGRIIDKGAA